MATITVDRVIAADPTSTALLLAGLTRVPPRRRPTSYVSTFDLGDAAAMLTLSYTGAIRTRAVLVVHGPSPFGLRAVAEAFLHDLAAAAEARSDAA